MVKLTTKYVIRQINSRKQFLVRRKNETDTQFLSRITHLYLQNQFIDQIVSMEEITNRFCDFHPKKKIKFTNVSDASHGLSKCVRNIFAE